MFLKTCQIFLIIFLLDIPLVQANFLSVSPAKVELELVSGEQRELALVLERGSTQAVEEFLISIEGNPEYLKLNQRQITFLEGQSSFLYNLKLDTTGMQVGTYLASLNFQKKQAADQLLGVGVSVNLKLEILDPVYKFLDLTQGVEEFSLYFMQDRVLPLFAQLGDHVRTCVDLKNTSQFALKRIPYKTQTYYKKRAFNLTHSTLTETIFPEEAFELCHTYMPVKIGTYKTTFEIDDKYQFSVTFWILPHWTKLTLLIGSLMLLLGIFIKTSKSSRN